MDNFSYRFCTQSASSLNGTASNAIMLNCVQCNGLRSLHGLKTISHIPDSKHHADPSLFDSLILIMFNDNDSSNIWRFTAMQNTSFEVGNLLWMCYVTVRLRFWPSMFGKWVKKSANDMIFAVVHPSFPRYLWNYFCALVLSKNTDGKNIVFVRPLYRGESISIVFNIAIRTWMSNYIYTKLWYLITHP